MAISTHHGSCHCGAVRFTVDIDVDGPSIVCNCSMCARSGAILSFVPEDKFTLDQGAENLGDYRFNKHVIHHLFCKTCGIKPFARGSGQHGPMVAINLRCVDGVDVFAAVGKAKQVDGKAR